MSVRPAFVAGAFYPAQSEVLSLELDHYLNEIPETGPALKAMIAPHAGYRYSAPIAASAYARLRDAASTIHRVILLGPSHRVPLRGLALPSVSAFETPLGQVAIDQKACVQIQDLPQVQVMDAAHEQEHSLEVHLPFLQKVLDKFSVVPLAVGQAQPEEVAEVLETLWGGPETLIVISSDLSHYHDYATAKKLDKATSRAIVSLDGQKLHEDSACGRVPIRGLLALAKQKGLHAKSIDVRNSGDTAGPHDQVVGYGAFVFEPKS